MTDTDSHVVYGNFKNSVDEWKSLTAEGTALFSKPLGDGSVPLQLQNVLDKLRALVEKMYTYRSQLLDILVSTTMQDALARSGKPVAAKSRKPSKEADDERIVIRPSAVDLAISLEEELACFEQEMQFRTTLIRGCIGEWPVSAEQYAACKASWIASPYLLELGKGPFARLVETLDVDKSLKGCIR